MINGATQLLKRLDEMGGLPQKLILKYCAAG
jgi:hypothetical protein